MKSDGSHYIMVAGKRLPLIAKKHPRARRLVVRYDARAQCVKLTLPRYVSLKSAVEFAESKAGWIEIQMQKNTRIIFADGAEIPLFGEWVKLVHIGGRGVVRPEYITEQGEARSGGGVGVKPPIAHSATKKYTLLIAGDAAFLERRVQDHIKQETKKIIVTKAEYYARAAGVNFRSITLRNSSSRWGSCSAKGGLSFCWRLAFAPLEVLDYVVCHEVAHLRHHNHSAAYWQLVGQLCPHYETHERWLKIHGQSVWGWG